MKPVRIATRRSELALWQARHIAARIETELERPAELLPLQTRGDRLLDVSLAKVGGKGLFVKEIEEALLDGRADVAVHSAKDLPAESPSELVFAAFPERADPRDALIAIQADSLSALPQGARVGTGSQRRRAQLARLRPDLVLVAMRGNVPTRLAKLDAGDCHALVLACAGLDRLELGERIRERIDTQSLLPAAGQGALAIQARRDDPLAAELAALGAARAQVELRAERACVRALGADCTVPLGAFAELDAAGRLQLRTRLLSPDGKACLEASRSGAAADAEALGESAAAALIAAGGDAVLEALQESP